MALVQADAVKLGDTVAIDIRGRSESAEVFRLPFYRRPSA